MYCKTTYENKTSNINQKKLQYTAPYFHEDKENLYTKTFYARMQENHSTNCSGCPTWCGQPFTENYCTNCSRRNKSQNVENLYVNEELGCNKQDYVTVLNPRHAGKANVSARGSMYGCDQINVEDVPPYKDPNKKNVSGTNTTTAGSSKGNHRNCAVSETWSSKHSEKCQDDYVKEFHEVNPVEKISSGGSYYKIGDISCSKTVESTCESDKKTRIKKERAPSHDENRRHKTEDIISSEKGECKSEFDGNRADKNETNFGFGSDEKKTSRKCTNSEEVAPTLGKINTQDPEKRYSKRVDKNEKNFNFVKDENKTFQDGKNFEEEWIADKSKPSMKAGKADAKKAYKGETFQQEDTDDQATNVKNIETAKAAGHSGRDRPKVSRGSKRMPRRRVQRKPQTHNPSNSEKPANGGVNEWLVFLVDSIKKGVVSALSGVPSYLSVGWSLLAYFLRVLILLVLFVLSCTWALLKSCAVHLWNVFPFLKTCVCSLRDRISHKEDTSAHGTFQQQSRPPPTRQRSDPLPGANELVSKLLASKDLDAYEILGVSAPSATDEEIKRSYRDMAKVVHPDKNPHKDASEAFKILQSAFDAISDEQKREAYEFNKDRKRLEEEMEEFFENFMEKVQEMKNKIMCRACLKSHPRLPTDRLIFAARYCSECGVRHPAREGDVWVETSHMGFKYYCFLCMNGQVYEVTEWGSCQGLLRLKANSHHVFISVRSNHHSPWDDMFGDDDRSGNNSKKKRKSKGKSNKNKKR